MVDGSYKLKAFTFNLFSDVLQIILQTKTAALDIFPLDISQISV